jgi:CheY-like chemotaxis protein
MMHKLLLADDSVTIQRVIELTFADEDVQVMAVSDGKAAIELIQRDRPDIVLADVGMPERNGYDVAAFIKADKNLAHIPVLLLTGAFEPVDEARAKAVGCDGVLVKPFEPQMVISRVKDLLSGRKPVSLWADAPAPPQQAPMGQPIQPAAGLASKAGADVPPAPAGSLEDYFDRLDAAFATLEGGQPEIAASPSQAAATPPAAAPQAAVSQPAATSAYGVGDDLAGWDPDLAGDPVRTRATEPPPAAEVPSPVAAVMPPPAVVLPPAAVMPPPAVVPQAADVMPPPVDVMRPPVAPVELPPPAPAPVALSAPVEAPPAPTPAPAAARTLTPDLWHAPTAAHAPLPSLGEAFAALLAAEQGQHFSPAVTPPQPVPDQVVEDIVRRVIARMSDQAVRETVVDVAERLVREEIARIKGTV